MLTETRWVPDTAITRKLKEVHDEKPGYILVYMPLKVSEFDDHSAHIKVHQVLLEYLHNVKELDLELYLEVYDHIREHMNYQLQESMKQMAQPIGYYLKAPLLRPK